VSFFRIPALLAGLALTTSAHAEVFCTATAFTIDGYVHGMPALEGIQLSAGGTMAPVSLCGTSCTDAATSQRLAIALTAQARGKSLLLYFASLNSCAAVPAYEKVYGVNLAP
jgi:hypothetical protein